MKDEPALPPLPKPDRMMRGFRPAGDFLLFTADQLHAYALAERAAERERCAAFADRWAELALGAHGGTLRNFAAAIRFQELPE